MIPIYNLHDIPYAGPAIRAIHDNWRKIALVALAALVLVAAFHYYPTDLANICDHVINSSEISMQILRISFCFAIGIGVSYGIGKTVAALIRKYLFSPKEEIQAKEIETERCEESWEERQRKWDEEFVSGVEEQITEIQSKPKSKAECLFEVTVNPFLNSIEKLAQAMICSEGKISKKGDEGAIQKQLLELKKTMANLRESLLMKAQNPRGWFGGLLASQYSFKTAKKQLYQLISATNFGDEKERVKAQKEVGDLFALASLKEVRALFLTSENMNCQFLQGVLGKLREVSKLYIHEEKERAMVDKIVQKLALSLNSTTSLAHEILQILQQMLAVKEDESDFQKNLGDLLKKLVSVQPDEFFDDLLAQGMESAPSEGFLNSMAVFLPKADELLNMIQEQIKDVRLLLGNLEDKNVKAHLESIGGVQESFPLAKALLRQEDEINTQRKKKNLPPVALILLDDANVGVEYHTFVNANQVALRCFQNYTSLYGVESSDALKVELGALKPIKVAGRYAVALPSEENWDAMPELNWVEARVVQNRANSWIKPKCDEKIAEKLSALEKDEELKPFTSIIRSFYELLFAPLVDGIRPGFDFHKSFKSIFMDGIGKLIKEMQKDPPKDSAALQKLMINHLDKMAEQFAQ